MEEEEEHFVDIRDFRSYYVSNLGNVASFKKGFTTYLKAYLRKDGYLTVVLCRDRVHYPKLVHKLVAENFLANPENKPEIDHKNHDRSDNRASNLRFATSQENNRNKSKSRNNTSGVVGVGFHKRIQKWCADIKVNNRQIHLGYFNNFDDAVRVRLEAEQRIFKEFAPTH